MFLNLEYNNKITVNYLEKGRRNPRMQEKQSFKRTYVMDDIYPSHV